MRILFLAPQPFFQERGTPIAVKLALNVLAEDPELEIDLLSYPEGKDINLGKVRHFRSYQIKLLNGVGPGISTKKILHDFLFFIKLISIIIKSEKRYDLIHAVEESVFFAWVIKLFSGIPYIYDMDSSIASQLTEKWYLLKPFDPFFRFFEKLAVKGSKAVVPVCDTLDILAKKHGAKDTQILRDISLLTDNHDVEINLRNEAGIKTNDPLILYVGNLERYQGIDLLLESFEIAATQADLIIIGGTEEHIKKYQTIISEFKTKNRIHFLGSRPLPLLKPYLMDADILVSPRTVGNNTPMKIYSYLHSGKAILATDLTTHNQVLNSEISLLVAAEPKAFAEGITKLVNNQELRFNIGKQAYLTAEKLYTLESFRESLLGLYSRIRTSLKTAA